MLIDCDTCEVRNVACSDCVVSVLLGQPAPDVPVELDDTERTAIGVLARSGLVPPLRLVPRDGPTEPGGTYDGRRDGGSARAG
ncbi:MAG: hypothetical protein ACLGIV_09950 [Actinomycetes bacterium]